MGERETWIRAAQWNGLGVAHRCGTRDCVGAAAADSEYCYVCQETMATLDGWYALHDGRASRAAMAFFRAGRAVRRLLWVPMTIFVIGGLLVLGASAAPAVMEWLAVEGWIQ